MTFETTMITLNRNLKEEKIICQEEKKRLEIFSDIDDSKRLKKREIKPSVSPFLHRTLTYQHLGSLMIH